MLTQSKVGNGLSPEPTASTHKSDVPLEHVAKNTLLTSHGRSPWYGEDGMPISNAFVIGIAGMWPYRFSPMDSINRRQVDPPAGR